VTVAGFLIALFCLMAGRPILVGGPTYQRLVANTPNPAASSLQSDSRGQLNHPEGLGQEGDGIENPESVFAVQYMHKNGWRVLHVDDDILVVEKGHSICSVPGVRGISGIRFFLPVSSHILSNRLSEHPSLFNSRSPFCLSVVSFYVCMSDLCM
jgi:hypothetical protein